MTAYGVYRVLLGKFGPRGWWPTTSRNGIRPAYHPGRRLPLSDRERFEIVLGTILTQNTAWRNVEKALVNLNLAGLTSPGAILRASAPRLRRVIRPSGFFVQKEARVRGFSRYLSDAHPEGLGKWLKTVPLAKLRAELLRLHGIGPETADSIILYAGGRLKFVVDAYTLRLAGRIGWLKNSGYGEAQAFFEENLPRSARCWQEFHALIVELAKRHCRKTPDCPACPLRRSCKTGKG